MLLVVFAGTASQPLAAANPLGFYVGGAIGQATVRADHVLFLNMGSPIIGPISLSGHDSGWKLLAGLRPISWIGAEIEYIDFGELRVSHQDTLSFVNIFGLDYKADMRAKAAAAFGVIYAPIPLPLLDVYGKAGLASLQTRVNGTAFTTCICGIASRSGEVLSEQTDIRFAFGAGAQVKLGAISIRAEYEHVRASGGDPDLLSVGATWSL